MKKLAIILGVILFLLIVLGLFSSCADVPPKDVMISGELDTSDWIGLKQKTFYLRGLTSAEGRFEKFLMRTDIEILKVVETDTDSWAGIRVVIYYKSK